MLRKFDQTTTRRHSLTGYNEPVEQEHLSEVHFHRFALHWHREPRTQNACLLKKAWQSRAHRTLYRTIFLFPGLWLPRMQQSPNRMLWPRPQMFEVCPVAGNQSKSCHLSCTLSNTDERIQTHQTLTRCQSAKYKGTTTAPSTATCQRRILKLFAMEKNNRASSSVHFQRDATQTHGGPLEQRN